MWRRFIREICLGEIESDCPHMSASYVDWKSNGSKSTVSYSETNEYGDG